MNLQIIIFGNTLLNYIYAVSIFIVLIVVFKIFQFYILKKLQKIAENTKTDLDDTFIKIIKNLKPPFYYFLAFYFATYSIVVSDFSKKIIENFLILIIVYQTIVAFNILIDYIFNKEIKNKEDLSAKVAMENISKFSKFMVWAFGFLLVLSNFGINITSLVAGLGVGGIAVAFALKNILADLFSSFAIYFDKPFKVGDFIKIGADNGTVEKIGIKTTRLKTPQGEELIISNQELTSARIQNFKKMRERRGLFSFGVAYETPVSKLREIPNDIKQIIESINGIRFGRAHFNRFDESALNFDVVYFVESNNYDKFADVQQEINLEIMKKFKEKKIEMAYPTRTIFMKNV